MADVYVRSETPANARGEPMASLDDGGSKPSTLSRRSTLSFIRTLLWKNAKLKRKHSIATLFELITPMLFIVLLNLTKQQSEIKVVPAGFVDDYEARSLFETAGGYTPIGERNAPLFVTPETSLSGLFLYLGYLAFDYGRLMRDFDPANRARCQEKVVLGGHVSLNPDSPFAVPSECEGRISPMKIAIAPDTTFTRAYFYETMKQWYPTVTLTTSNADVPLVIPSFEDSVVFYDTVQDMEKYIESSEYASRADRPRLFGAIVFDDFPNADTAVGTFTPIEYTIRLNATNIDVEDDTNRFVPRTLSKAGASAWSPFQRDLVRHTYQQYTSGGFMTLQTLVARFLNCMPEWDATTKTTTGDCQVAESVAQTRDDVDAILVSSIEDDPAVQQILQLASSVAGDTTTLSLALTDEERAQLVRPLRQAPQPYVGATVSPFPIESYDHSSFYDAIKNVFPLVFMLAYLHPLSKILVSLIGERESRSRELMKILGVTETSIVTSWYITYTVILIVSAILQTIAAKAALFESSNVVLLFLFFFLFSMSVLAFGFMASTVFSKARTGTYVALVLFFIMYAISNAFKDDTAEASKNWGSLLSPVALVFAVKAFAEVETSEIGMNFSNASVRFHNYRFSTALWFFALDTVLYTLVGLYLEKVVPKAYGTTERWYFPFQPSFWFRRRQAEMDHTPGTHALPSVDEADFCGPNIEENPELQARRSLTVHQLRKVFPVPGGEKEAVKSINLHMYSGQITCLLGHNGAGKTTLISMLTGVTPPTSGNAYLNGLSIKEDMDEIRSSLGICFQHDVLYPELSVAEHLEFYARIKGFRGDHLQNEITAKIGEVGLVDKREVLSNALSGGMKRKLSVAIALLGDSSLVFLDEPTSGMDPYSRRSTWEMLLNNRHNRVLVLTTHFMDEADVLGDRIAIMAEGELRCCGSPLFLKNRYGAGYNLTIVKHENSDDGKVIQFISSHIPSAKVLSNVGTEIAFQLSLDSAALFPEMFRQLDSKLDELRVASYGISVTTMEEVFIKVAEAGDEANQHTLKKQVKNHSLDSAGTTKGENTSVTIHASTKTRTSKPKPMFGGQLLALLQKRFWYSKRDKRMLLYSLFLPIGWLILGLSLLNSDPINKIDPRMPLNFEGLRSDAGSVVLPSYCMETGSDVCSSILSPTTFTQADVSLIDSEAVGSSPYASTATPTVFGVQYTARDLNASGLNMNARLLKLSEVIYERGYKGNTQNQFGGYMMYSNEDNGVIGYNLLVNTTLPHGSVVVKNLVDEAIYKFMASRADGDVDTGTLSLKVNSFPLPQTAKTTALFNSYLSFSACMFIAIAFTYYPASIVALLVKEKHPDHNSKHQQMVSGANLFAFWFANYVWDLLIYIIPFGVALLLINVYNLSALSGSSECISCTDSTFPAVVLLFVFFGLAICPYSYFLSFLFKDPASAQTYTIMINFVLGLGLMITSFVLDVIESTRSANKILKFIWRFSPIYNLGMGLLNVTIIEIQQTGGGEWVENQKIDPFALENMGYELLFSGICAVLYLSLALGFDYALTFPKFKALLSKDPSVVGPDEEVDQDVLAEAQRIASGEAKSDVVQLENLRKVYKHGPKLAVQDLSFGLKRGECFGFLGINGAGKTTTMKMLTGDIVPTAGRASLAGFDILTQQLDVRREIGYCPQFDALIDLLTVREHLELFARIKGVPSTELEAAVYEKMEQMNLLDFENKLAGSLSGGNKRKLSVAIALIGSPSILFLDEPSTGMDPVSRRFMWDVISEISTYNKESTVVLTTHSMEECEALCTRVGIMVAGGLKCLGSVQHLKHRFGDGLMVDVKLQAATKEDVEAFIHCHLGSPDAALDRDQLTDICSRLGQPSWTNRIVNTHPTGYALVHALERDGTIPAKVFALWWLNEVRFGALEQFLHESFGQVSLLERRNDSCWFKLHEHDKQGFDTSLKLSAVFEAIESTKSRLGIREYSVSQTTLEQIFNSFASQQHQGEAIQLTPVATSNVQAV